MAPGFQPIYGQQIDSEISHMSFVISHLSFATNDGMIQTAC